MGKRLLTAAILCLLGAITAPATEYDLFIPESADSLRTASRLTLYESFDIVKPGDHIVTVRVRALPRAFIACSLTPTEGAGPVLSFDKTAGFKGKISLARAEGPAGSVKAGLLMHSPFVAPPPTNKQGVWANVRDYVNEHPTTWIALAIGGIGLILLAVLQVFKRDPASPPVYGKRAFEENVRVIKEKLERMEEAQVELVKKPPVLRAFRKQIEGFDRRLHRIESFNTSAMASFESLADSIALLTRELSSVSDASEGRSRSLAETLQKLKVELASASSALEKQIQSGNSAHESRHQDLVKSLSSLQSAQAGVAASVSSVTADLKGTKDAMSEALTSNESKLDALHGELHSSVSSLSARIDATSAESKATSAELLKQVAEDLQPKLFQLSEEIGLLRLTHEALSQTVGVENAKLSELIAKSKADLVLQSNAQSERLGQIAESQKLLPALREELTQLKEGNAKILSTTQESASDLSIQLSDFLKGELEPLAAGIESVSRVEEKVQVVQERIDALGKSEDLAALQHEVKGLGRSVEDSAKSQSELLAQLRNADSRVAELQEVLSTLSATAERRDEKVDSIAVMAQEILSSLPSIATLDARFSGLASHDETTQESIQSLAKLIESLAAEVGKREELEGLLRSTSKSIEGLPSSIESLHDKLSSLPTPEAPDLSSELQEVAKHLRDVISSEIASVATTSAPAVVGEAATVDLQPIEEKLSSLEATLQVLAVGASVTPAPVDLTPVTQALEAERERRELLEKNLAVLQDSVSKLPDALSEIQAKVAAAPAPTAPAQPEVVQLPPKAEAAPEMDEPKAPTVIELNFESPVEEEEEEEKAPEEPVEEAASTSGGQWWETASGVADEEPAVSGKDWPCQAGSCTKTWTHVAERELKLKEALEAVRALTPAATPEITFPMGAMLYVDNRVVFAHGDAVRGFWPGKNEKNASLPSALGSEPSKMLHIAGNLFCNLENKVEIVGLDTWARKTSFEGKFLDQLALGDLWAGVQASGKQLAVQFRGEGGEVVGKTSVLEAPASKPFVIAGSGKTAFLASSAGALYKVQPGGAKRLDDLAKTGEPLAVAIHNKLLWLIVKTAKGLSLQQRDLEGSLVRESALEGKDLQGNSVFVGDKLYFGSDTGELVSFDTKQMLPIDRVHVGGVAKFRGMSALQIGKHEMLIASTLDGEGLAGAVLIYDPKTGEQMRLCSTNQPNVDVILAGERVVVGTRNSFQNVIRVFEPFQPVEMSKAA